MKNNLLKSGILLVILSAAVATGVAEETNAWKRIGVSYRMGFNISADFSGLGGFLPAGNPPGNPGGPGRIAGAPGTVVRTYDDGFIGIDISGNANQHTTFWGYNNSAVQVVGGAVQMHSTSSPANGASGGVDGDPQHGIELNYLHPLGGGEEWRWGLEGAFNWMDIGIEDRRSLRADIVTRTHAFALDDVTPPVAPPTYVGPVNGPGAPQLSDNAVDVSGPPLLGAGSISGRRSLNADLYGFRLGPFLEFDVFPSISLGVGGGFAFGVIDSEFSFSDTVNLGAFGSQTVTGSNRRSELLYGGYVRGQINVNVYKRVSVFSAVEFNSLGTFNQTAGNARAHLDLSSAIFLTFGVSVSF